MTTLKNDDELAAFIRASWPYALTDEQIKAVSDLMLGGQLYRVEEGVQE